MVLSSRRILRAQAPRSIQIACQYATPLSLPRCNGRIGKQRPVAIELNLRGEVTGIRYSNHSVQPFLLPVDEMEAYYAAYRTFGAIPPKVISTSCGSKCSRASCIWWTTHTCCMGVPAFLAMGAPFAELLYRTRRIAQSFGGVESRMTTIHVRLTARLLVIDEQERILLFNVDDGVALHHNRPELINYWITPGGGVE